MTTFLDTLLEAAGVAVELPIVESGTRGCVIGRPAIGGRALLTVVGPDLPAAARRHHPGWDLPLRQVEDRETPSGVRTIIIEDLPAGVPSTSPGARGWGADGPAPYVLSVARLVTEAHDRGEVVGWLQPDLVFVDATAGALVAIAQRPIRAALAATAWEGDAPLFGLAYLTPGEARGQEISVDDDVHRLAALVWRWRNGVPPFHGLSESQHLHRLAGAAEASGGAAAVDQPAADDLDRLLAKALDPGSRDRPRAAAITSALASAGASWRLARVTS